MGRLKAGNVERWHPDVIRFDVSRGRGSSK